MSVPVKICGLTDPADGESCADVWAAGFILAPGSRRTISASQAACIETPAGVLRVGVIGPIAPAALGALVRRCRLDAVQSEDQAVLDTAAALGVARIGVVRVTGPEALRRCSASNAEWVLLDGTTPGSGQRADWALIGARRPTRPFGLAGGLNAGTLAEAITRTGASWVDVSTGVERDGRKDPDLIAAVVAAASAPGLAERPQ